MVRLTTAAPDGLRQSLTLSLGTSAAMDKKRVAVEGLERLQSGRCPIHGLWMSQVEGWYYPDDEPPYTIVGCPRRDCRIKAKAKAYDYEGPWKLLEEFEALLQGELPDPEYLIPVERTPQKRNPIGPTLRKVVWEKTRFLGLSV